MSWTDERVEMLKKLWAEGKSASQIANHLGGVSRNAVIGKAHRLGLSGRPSPIKARKAVRKEPEKAAVPEEKPSPTGASILQLTERMCKWPIGDPADPNFAFCGRKAECGPYCAEHAKIAFQPARKRDRKPKDTYDFIPKIAG